MSRARPRVPAFAKHIATAFALFMLGCSSGSSCSSCGGIEPLPGGFDVAKKIENAGSARLTQSGIQFLQDNIGALAGGLFGSSGGSLNFPINDSGKQDLGFGTDYQICKGGPQNADQCNAEISFTKSALTLKTADAHDLKLGGKIAIRLKDLPVDAHIVFVPLSTSIVLVDQYDGDDPKKGCPGDAGGQDFANIGLDVDISIEADPNQMHSRYGYTRLAVKTVSVNTDDLKNHLHPCGHGFGSDVLDDIKDALIGTLAGTINNLLQSQIEQQLCQKPNPDISPSCPTGSNDVNGICRYGSDDNAECVSTMLGTDGHANLGGLLASLSPGTQGGLDFLFAAGGSGKSTMNPQLSWGDLEPINNGGTIGLYGGAEANPVSKCVKMSELALPTAIPIPDELFGNTVTGWPAGTPGPHVGIALSERFANYGLSSAYNSGLLCIGVSTESVALLNSGTIGLLIPSSKDLAIQHEAQEIGLVIRPSKPPTIQFGNGTNLTSDPLLRIKLEQASFDFYIFSLDRYVRFMTATYDLDVPMNLTVSQAGLTPVLDKIGVTNGKVTNNQLLSENPKQIADALGSLIAGQVGQAVGGGIAPINLNSALASFGLSLVIPDSKKGQGSPGLRKLTKGTDNYLGIFAGFELATAMNDYRPPVAVETSATVVHKDIDPKGVRFASIDANNQPVIRMSFASASEDASHPLEYSYRVDNGFWHPYSDDRIVDVSDPYLRVQGKHVISVRGRVAGEPKTTDVTPAEVPVIIDVDAPVVKVGDVGDDGKAQITAKDLVSDADHEFVRVRLDGGDWSSWQPASEARFFPVGKAKEIEVEARDEEGNVGKAKQALLRGRASSAAGCGCEVAGGTTSTSNGSLWLLAIAVGGVVARMARSRKQGRSDDDAPPPPAPPVGGGRKLPSSALRGVGALAALGVAFSWAGCSCGDSTETASSSNPACVKPDCQTLEPGLIGEYTSVAVDGKSLWVAGYAEANWDQGFQWGDLVVGKWNGKKVAWKSVDGVPDMPVVDGAKFDKSGYRGGQTDPGDDVGLWTSIAVNAKGLPAVAYYDRGNKQLKFAVNLGGDHWNVDIVDSKPQGDVGRYPKLLPQNGGWAIAYQSIEPGGDAGAAISRVRLATTTSAKPTASEWSIEDVAVDKKSPCRSSLCGGSTVCVASTARCTATVTGCKPICASGEACVKDSGKSTCVATFGDTKLDSYPDAIGDYISIAPTADGGIGVVYYDRPRGNLVAAVKNGSSWKTAIIDGQGADGTDSGDTGVGASLSIDSANTWHITYVDGITEALKYVKLSATLKITGGPEIVDDGSVLNGVQNADGQHLVGDDSSIFVTESGEIHVSYADSTAGTLRYAVGVPTSDTHKWTVQVIDQQGRFAGAFSHLVQLDGSLQIVNWWRTGGSGGAIGDVAVVKP